MDKRRFRFIIPATLLIACPFIMPGASAASIKVRLKVWLEGAYQAGGSMSTDIKTGGLIPAVSPFSDGRDAGAVPDGVVDWVCVELRESGIGPVSAERSFFLKSDGGVVETDGITADLTLDGVEAGFYFIVIRHRNHLAAMSANMQNLSSASVLFYDFSAGLDRYYGTGAGRARELEPGVYGMTAGDANGSGTVDAADRSATWNDRNKSGYFAADCNLSGTVDAADRSIMWNNRNRSTGAPAVQTTGIDIDFPYYFWFPRSE